MALAYFAAAAGGLLLDRKWDVASVGMFEGCTVYLVLSEAPYQVMSLPLCRGIHAGTQAFECLVQWLMGGQAKVLPSRSLVIAASLTLNPSPQTRGPHP